mmetsp:Transcript_36830/g.57587  ORF Transcript_36830/g.57587 Transcript_36830/m.57587 type:complete len:119 (+) Transcript_36830:127-483(+)
MNPYMANLFLENLDIGDLGGTLESPAISRALWRGAPFCRFEPLGASASSLMVDWPLKVLFFGLVGALPGSWTCSCRTVKGMNRSLLCSVLSLVVWERAELGGSREAFTRGLLLLGFGL